MAAVGDWRERATLTPEEARGVLNIGRRQMYERIAKGEIPAIRTGRSIRVSVTELRRLLGELPAG